MPGPGPRSTERPRSSMRAAGGYSFSMRMPSTMRQRSWNRATEGAWGGASDGTAVERPAASITSRGWSVCQIIQVKYLLDYAYIAWTG